MGNKIVHTGGHGTETSMKMVVNLLLGNAMVAFAEGMALGEGLGISRKVLFDSLARFDLRNGGTAGVSSNPAQWEFGLVASLIDLMATPDS